ncbi:MAG TPA: DUF3152 domain-containing protein [Nevskiaceae bacterium]|nr:DUF3152 domain-containing protein [Nevskiaceae bacterium]
MRVIRHKQFGQQVSARKRWLRPTLMAVAVLIVVFVLANIGMWLAYRNRVLPNYLLGAAPVGNTSYADLRKQLGAFKLLPQAVTLSKDGHVERLTPRDVGMQGDEQASIKKLQATKPLLPLLSLVTHHDVPLVIKVDAKKFDTKAAQLAAVFTKAPQDKHVIFNGQTFTVQQATNGYKLDTAGLQSTIKVALASNKTTATVPVATVTATNTNTDLSAEIKKLQKQLSAAITYHYLQQKKQVTTSDIGSWYVPSGQTMVLSTDRITQYIAQTAKTFNITALNAGDGAAAATYAISNGQTVNFVLATQGQAVVRKYCTAVRGVSTALLPSFEAKLAATYGDPRGWGLGGKVAFVHADSGCNFTAWLSAPASVPGFGSICDAYYSCTVSPHVIINYDRWQGATTPWNQAGGNLEDYRVMVINHETGHWLGFNHASCPGPGQPAPVMMQQSINLGGCAFNPWPVASELQTLKQTLGIAAIKGRDDTLALMGGSGCSCGQCAVTA